MIVQPAKRRNMLVLYALFAWFLAAAGLFTWASLQNAQFAARLRQATTDMQQIVGAAPAALKTAKDTGGSEATAGVLRNISAKLSQKATSMPAPPTPLGLLIGGDAERTKQRHVKEAAEAYAVKLSEAADYIVYQDRIARQLQGLSLKDAAQYDRIIDLANAWQATIQNLQNDTKPQRVTTIIATLLQKMNIAEKRIRALADAYKKNDMASFNTEQTQLAATIASFKENGAQIVAIGVQIDDELQSAATKLVQNL